MDLTSAVAFLQAHWDEILAVIGGCVTVASIIVKITPSQADDAVLAKVIKVLDYLSIVNPKGLKVTKDAAAQPTEPSMKPVEKV